MGEAAALFKEWSGYLKPEDISQLQSAYHFSEAAHEGQFRKSGEPYISHPLAVANILAQWHLDPQALTAALLHDVMEDTAVTKTEITRNFGKPVAFTTYDSKVLNGWNVREYSWDVSVGVQQQLASRVSAEVTYVRRSWGNQTVTDNRALSSSDFDRFSLTAPSDPRLPGGGGYPVDGIYEVKADKFGLVDNFVTHAKTFGDGRIERWRGATAICKR